MTLRPCEEILTVGCEGGSLTLFGIRTPEGWRFSRNVNDQSAMFLDDPDLHCVNHDSEFVNSWTDGLKMMDPDPWHKLHPLEVHPEFQQMVYDAVIARYNLEGGVDPDRLFDWKRVCGISRD